MENLTIEFSNLITDGGGLLSSLHYFIFYSTDDNPPHLAPHTSQGGTHNHALILLGRRWVFRATRTPGDIFFFQGVHTHPLIHDEG